MVLKKIAQAVLGLLLLLVTLLLVSRWWPASAAQQQARAALESPQQWSGRNVWPLLATLDHPGLDAAQRDALVGQHAGAFAQWADASAAQRYADQDAAAPQSDAPELPAPAAAPLPALAYCRPTTLEGCLAHVRGDTTAVVADLAARSGLIERIAGLAAYQHARSPYQPDVAAPLPAGLARLFTALPAHALAHVQGNSDAALAGLCRDMGSARMLASRSDSLVVTMLGARWLQANGQLLAEVLAELPSDHALPASCELAQQPLDSDAISLCRPLRGEYAMAAAVMRHSHAQALERSALSGLVFDLDKTLNRHAQGTGQACQAPLQARINDDLPVELRAANQASPSLWRIDCLSNAMGCVLSGIAAPAYDKYIVRMQDVAAGQRLLGAWLWLRQQPGSDDAASLLAQLPPQWHSAQRPVVLGVDGSALEVARYERAQDQAGQPLPPLRLPLPTAR